jgi:flagella basal body P-ring formation protein FlgA
MREITVKKTGMKRMLMAVAMAAVIVNSAHAASPQSNSGAEPRSEVLVEKDVVTVGDVFSGVTQDAGYVLAPAPGYGKTLTLNVNDLRRISDTFGLGWSPANGIAQSVVRRNAQELGAERIEAALEGRLASEMKGRKFGLQLYDRASSLVIPANMPSDIGVSGLKYDFSSGEFRATVFAPAGSASPAARREVSGRIFPVTQVPVLKGAMQQGDVISAEDIEYIDLRAAELGANVITDAKKIIGMSPRRGLAGFRPVTPSDIVPPVVVKKGEMVTMLFRSDMISLTAQGKALESGAAGEVVKVVNKSSGQSVEAVVTGLREVTIAPPDARM